MRGEGEGERERAREGGGGRERERARGGGRREKGEGEREGEGGREREADNLTSSCRWGVSRKSQLPYGRACRRIPSPRCSWAFLLPAAPQDSLRVERPPDGVDSGSSQTSPQVRPRESRGGTEGFQELIG